METFIGNNASAVMALVGAFGGTLLSYFSAWMLRRRDFELRVWDKLLERRIAAHEELIAVALEMRVMVGLGGSDENRQVRRAPQMLMSKDTFENWFVDAIRKLTPGTTWLSTRARREANYLQDYLVNLHMRLADIPSDKYSAVGEVIRQDFIEISNELEKAAFEYFRGEVRELKLSDLGEWHKHPLSETKARLDRTHLFRSSSELDRLRSQNSTIGSRQAE